MKDHFTSKSHHLCPFLQIYGVNYDNKEDERKIQPLNKSEKLLANINIK